MKPHLEDLTATEAELDCAADLLALVQWKLWERDTQGKDKSVDTMSGHSDHLTREDVTRTLLAQKNVAGT